MAAKKRSKTPGLSSASSASPVKKVVLAVFGVGIAVLFSYFLLQMAVNPNWGNFWLLLIFAILFPIGVTVDSILIRDRRAGWAFSALLALGLCVFFLNQAGVLTLLILFVLNLLFLRLASHSGKKIYENLLHFRWHYVAPHVLRPAFATLALSITVLYFAAVPIQDPAFTKPLFVSFAKSVDFYLDLVAPGTTMDSTVQDFLLNAAAAEGIVFNNDAEKEIVVKEAITKLNENIKENLKIDFALEPQQVLSDVFYSMAVMLIQTAKPELLSALIFTLGLLFYFTLFTFTIPLAGFSVWIGLLFFKVLGALKFYSIVLEDRKKELLVL